jgi:glucose/arabinose dehydrogenase
MPQMNWGPSQLSVSVFVACCLQHGLAAQNVFSEQQVATQLNSPVSMAIAPDGRVFIAQQGGDLVVVSHDVLLPTPFVSVPTVADDEEGLLGVAFDPNFATNQYVYVFYTAQTPTLHSRISRFTANGDVAVPGSETVLFDLDDDIFHYHVGGALHCDANGHLFFSTGDNNSAFWPENLGSTHGKLLCINTDGTIPATNPFYSTSGANQAIYAIGFRNAFTFDIQPATGRIFLNDVGSNMFEEVNDIQAGGDYGWPTTEGPTHLTGLIDPIHSFPSHGNGACALCGGAFYNPASPQFPAQYVGMYFYSEYCTGEIRCIDPASPANYTPFRTASVPGPVDLRVGDDGSLYYLARGDTNNSGGNNIFTGVLTKVTYGSATFTSYGTGCGGRQGVPTLGTNGPPRLNSPALRVTVGNLFPNTLAILALGFSNTNYAAGTLPLNLGLFGMPGCSLLTSAEVSVLQANGPAASVGFGLPIPGDPTLLGVHLYAQGFVFDAGANLLGVVASPGGDLQIGT